MNVDTIICCVIFGIPISVFVFWIVASMLKLFWVLGKAMFDNIGY